MSKKLLCQKCSNEIISYRASWTFKNVLKFVLAAVVISAALGLVAGYATGRLVLRG